jgi:hypothetical protein
MQQATQRVLTVRHTCDKRRQPLAVIDGFPGLGAELNPTQLRRLARLLNTIANDSCQGASGAITYEIEAA